MRILIFGKNGQVGAELARYSFPQDVSVLQLGREDCNVEDFRMTALAVRHSGADVVINTTAYSDLAGAENERERARILNSTAPAGMAKAASELVGCPIVHLSTADVFAGDSPNPYQEGDRVAPVSAFARTKEAGERGVIRANDRHVIVRTSWVFGALGKGVVQETLAQARAGKPLEAANQRGCPTPAQAVADACVRVAMAAASGKAQWGIYHFCGAPPATRAEFLEAILEAANPSDRPRVQTAAGATVNSVLDCSRIKEVYGIDQPDWRAALKGVVKEAAGPSVVAAG